MIPPIIWIGYLVISLACVAGGAIAIAHLRRARQSVPALMMALTLMHVFFSLFLTSQLYAKTVVGWTTTGLALPALIGSIVFMRRSARARS
jgi:hypothetical protein